MLFTVRSPPLLAFLGFAVSPLCAERIDVYLLAGQSNMSGRVSTGYTGEAGDDEVLYYYRSDGPASNNQTSGGNFGTLAPLATGFYGPEISLVRSIQEKSSDRIAVVKVSDGGTSLATDWNSRATGGNTWWLNWKNDTTDAWNDLLALGHTPVLKGICWLQGESDSNSQTRANAYETNFTNLVEDMFSHMAALTDVSATPFVTARIGMLSATTYPFAATIRTAQRSVMETSVRWHWFDTTDLATTDGVHFDVAAVATVGRRFASRLLFPTGARVSVSRGTEGDIRVDFTGTLYQSGSLEPDSWTRMDPQPSSPYVFMPAQAGRMFFRASDE